MAARTRSSQPVRARPGGRSPSWDPILRNRNHSDHGYTLSRDACSNNALSGDSISAKHAQTGYGCAVQYCVTDISDHG